MRLSVRHSGGARRKAEGNLTDAAFHLVGTGLDVAGGPGFRQLYVAREICTQVPMGKSMAGVQPDLAVCSSLAVGVAAGTAIGDGAEHLGKRLCGIAVSAGGTLAVGMAALWMGAVAVYGVASVYLGRLGTSVVWGLFQIFMIITANSGGIATGEWKTAASAARG